MKRKRNPGLTLAATIPHSATLHAGYTLGRFGTATNRNGPGSAAHRGSLLCLIFDAWAALHCARDTGAGAPVVWFRLPERKL